MNEHRRHLNQTNFWLLYLNDICPPWSQHSQQNNLKVKFQLTIIFIINPVMMII